MFEELLTDVLLVTLSHEKNGTDEDGSKGGEEDDHEQQLRANVVLVTLLGLVVMSIIFEYATDALKYRFRFNDWVQST